MWTEETADQKSIRIKNADGETKRLLILHSSKYDVLTVNDMQLSKGDKIRNTRNGFDANEKRLNNGQMLEIVSVRKNGSISSKNESGTTFALHRSFGHLTPARCITSQVSQGKTVNEVYIAQPAANFPGTDAKQF